MKLSITKIYRSWKNKEGNPLKTKDGREYERVAIRCKEHGEKWLSGFGGQWNSNWQIGDEVEVDIEEDGEYLNFRKPDPIKKLEERVTQLEDRLEDHISADSKEAFEEEDNTDEEIKDDDIPF